MKTKLLTLILTVIISILHFSCTPTGGISRHNKIKTTEGTKNSVAKDYKKILFFSAGDIHFRRLSEGTYEHLAEEVTYQHASSKFFYLGDDLSKAAKQLREIIAAETYDAMMIMIPTDTANIDIIITQSPVPTFNGPGVFAYYRSTSKDIRLKQKALFVLYDKTESDNLVWNTHFDMNLRFHHDSGVKKISKIVLRSLKSNNILNKYPHG